MKPTQLLTAFLSLLPLACSAAWEPAKSVTLEEARTSSKYAALLRRCTAMASGGYMRQNPQAELTVVPKGWRSVRRDARLREYHYTVSDRAVSGGKKQGWVILFDAEPERLTAWIANAVIETSRDQKTYSEARAITLAKKIANQSGAQFPVAGLVWEDMEGSGHPKAYGFLDGVTVLGAPADFYQGGNRTTAKLGPEALKAGLSVPWEAPARAGKYARVASTERDHVTTLYTRMGKTPPALAANAYPIYVRKTYQQAMDSTRNELFVASALTIP